MIKAGITLCQFLVLMAFFPLHMALATEYTAHGIADFRVSYIDSLDKGYLTSGQGKLGLGDGLHFSVAQIYRYLGKMVLVPMA